MIIVQIVSVNAAYMFHENLIDTDDSPPTWVVITELSTVIIKNWSHQQMQSHIGEHHMNQNNQ